MKFKKYPKKPRRSASVEVLENYIKRCRDVDKDNSELKKRVERKKKLQAEINKIRR